MLRQLASAFSPHMFRMCMAAFLPPILNFPIFLTLLKIELNIINSQNFSLSLLAGFFGQPVVVDTPMSLVTGVLLKAGVSKHGGIGCLLLETRLGWVLIKEWFAIKKRM
jgi:uncharacterized integral membrane protein